MNRWLKYSFLVLTLLLFLSSCGKKQTMIYSQPELPGAVYYQKAWVEPKIILSDTLITLIKAERIDSFLVKTPSKLTTRMDNSIQFEVTQDSCYTYANLLNAKGQVIEVLMTEYLSKGFYKLNCDVGRINFENNKAGYFFIKGRYCGSEISRKIP